MNVSMAQHELRTEELDYALPEGLIATRPVEPRDSARMMVLHRSNDVIEHRHIRDLADYLHSGDTVVFNNTAVIPARLLARRIDTGGKVQGLYLREVPTSGGAIHWQVMLKAGGRLEAGQKIELLDRHQRPSGFVLELVEKVEPEWIVRVEQDAATQVVLNAVGWTPLPPYILHARETEHALVEDRFDRDWYQTVYADAQRKQSVAAPTAGLHFTPELLAAIEAREVRRVEVTLHVGAGTFKPVTAATLSQHRMHSESFEVSAHALTALRRARLCDGCQIIAIGTTVVRTLESLPLPLPVPANPAAELCGSFAGMTDLMIAPPYEFKLVDGMLTNFHLPRSTLMALVAAMLGDDGLNRLKVVYREAIEKRYRFYSYGDAMLILP